MIQENVFHAANKGIIGVDFYISLHRFFRDKWDNAKDDARPKSISEVVREREGACVQLPIE